MISLNLSELAQAAKGTVIGNRNAIVESMAIDSRDAKRGCMFVCLVGEKTDGHQFAENAYSNGCRNYLMSDEKVANDFSSQHDDVGIILASNTKFAFRDMAKWYIDRLNVKRIAVTGSVGKTTTKSLTATVLSSKYNVISSQKNHNTILGLSMTSFLADEDTEIIVYEMGMDQKGEIESYCEWVRPETCIITTIGDSHLERLGSKSAIADAKLEITKFMSRNDALIYNCNSDFLDRESLIKRTRMNFIPIPVGFGDDATVQISNVFDQGLSGISFDVSFNQESAHVRLPLLGKHNAPNASLAITCGMLYGIKLTDCAKAIAAASGVDKRLAFEEINGLYLLDDSYNASPASMMAALDVLAALKARRKVAILADMYELGSDEVEGHIKTGERAAELGINLLIAIGKNANLMAQGALSKSDKISIVKFENVSSAIEKIMGLIGYGDAVLVKGSNATKVSAVAEMIRSLKV